MVKHLKSFALNEDDYGSFKLGTDEVKLTTDCRDYHSGQAYMSTYATVNNRTVGHIDWSEYENKIYIDYVQVVDSYKRKVIATAMMDSLAKYNPGKEIVHGYTSDEGGKFLTPKRSSLSPLRLEGLR